MSYRALKRLIGESGLERKCRVLLGAGTAVLVAISFWWYASLTDNVAREQLQQTGRTLVTTMLTRAHLQQSPARESLDEFQKRTEEEWKETWKDFTYKLITPSQKSEEHKTLDPEEAEQLANYTNDPKLPDHFNPDVPGRRAHYFAPIKAEKMCLDCHRNPLMLNDKAVADLQDGQLLGVMKIGLSSATIDTALHRNRALLLTLALGTTLLVSLGSFLIIRYVVVKPVKHLKEVSDAIAEGALNVRSEIQTGDEFEDLSHAFNRMLRNLIGMQDRNRTLITELDGKLGELARANLALYESNRLKGDFLHTMSHELRTPLNSIIGFSEVLLAAENLSEKQHRYAANIMTGGQQLMAQINDVLDLGKLEAGKMRVHPQPLAVSELIENAAAQVRPHADKKNLELVVLVTPGLPMIRQDAVKLRQILGNLLSNAVKFTPEGGKVTMTASIADGKLVITVTDTGVGIAPAELDTIFEKFRQSANPLTREQGGTGLGLSIVRELANLLGGDIAVRSTLGLGSTFTVRVAADLKVDHLPVSEPPTEGMVPG
jgi:two-component system sensor histidine kinase BarA